MCYIEIKINIKRNATNLAAITLPDKDIMVVLRAIVARYYKYFDICKHLFIKD